MSGEEIARELVSVVTTTYSINSSRLVACMRDEATSNDVPIRSGYKVFNHTLHRVGEHLEIPILIGFILLWMSIFTHSSKGLWREETATSIKSFS